MKNVHKVNAKVINLPTDQLAEDRGYKFCGKPYLTFANAEDGSVSWQNDLFSVAFIADSVEVVLEKDGTELTAFGVTLDFPNQPDAVGFMIIWREVLLNHGAGCYKVKANYVLQGIEFTLHYGSFDLMPYSVQASESTIRVLGQYNDEVKMYGINFAGSSFARTFRVKGNLHNEQPNTEHGNILKGDDKFAKYRNHGQISYDLETAPLVACELDPLFELLISSNKIYVSDFNSANFRQYRDIEVILRGDEEISYGEQFGSERQLFAPFKQKNWLVESKYSEGAGDGQIFTSGLDFDNLVCPTVVCADATVNVNKSDSTLIQAVTVASGGLEPYNVDDSVITVNSATFASVKATDSLNVPIVDSNGDAVATTVVGGEVQVDDLPCEAPADEWIRPADWLDMPTLTSTDDEIALLHAVWDNDSNFAALRCATTTGDYQVDWGDGTVTTHASNVTAEHQYDYATYDTGGATLSSRGYKQAMIRITPLTGGLDTFNTNFRHSTQNQAYATGYLDVLLSMPNASAGGSIQFYSQLVSNRYMEQVEILNSGGLSSASSMFRDCTSLQSVPLFDTSSVTSFSSMFSGCTSLQSVPLFDTSNVTTMSSMFSGCTSLQSVPLFDTSNVTTMSSMFSGCTSLQSVPLFDTSNVTNMGGMFQTCSSLQSVPLFDTSSVTNMGSMFNGCTSLQSVPLFNTLNVTNMERMFQSCDALQSVPLFDTSNVTNMLVIFFKCFSLQSVPLFDTSNVTNIRNMFDGCRSLQKIPAFNTSSVTLMSTFARDCSSHSNTDIICRVSVDFRSNQLSRDGIVNIFNNLLDRTSLASANIQITGNYGVADLSTADLEIATDKNWTVTT